MTPSRPAPRRSVLAAVVALALLPGCLTYETSYTRVDIDRRTGIASLQTTYRNIASTESGRNEQWEDFEQLDSLRRSDPYFATSYLRSPDGGSIGTRRVWIEKGRIHASASVKTRDLNEIAEGWSADSSGYRFMSNLRILSTNGRRMDDEKPTVFWPRGTRVLTVTEGDPHFGEAIPFRAEIRDSLARRLPHAVKAPAKRASAHGTTHRATKKRSRRH